MTRVTAAFVAYFALAIALTYPLFFTMADHVPIIPIDNVLNTWILAWDYHALATHPLRLFDANIFYPIRKTLTLSEHLLGDLPIFAPLMAVSGNPLLAANGVVFASFVLSATAMFALAWRWTRSASAAFFAGFVFAFSPPRFGQLAKWHLLSVQWTPLTLLFLDRFLVSRRMRDGALACAFFVLQVFASYYLGYACALVVACYLAYRFWSEPSLRTREIAGKLGLLLAAALLIILPLTYPYVRVSRESGLFGADLRLLTLVSTDPALSFLGVPQWGHNVYQEPLRRFQSQVPWESWLFPGFVPVALALVALCMRSRGEARDRRPVAVCVLITSACVVMSLGPVLVINEHVTGVPLPYLLCSYVIPGFAAMRAPARFALLAWVGFSVLVGLGARRLLGAAAARAPWSPRVVKRVLAAVLLAAATTEFWFPPLEMDRFETGRRVPEVYRWLAAQPRDGAVIELPWEIQPDQNRDPAWRRYALFDRAMERTNWGINLADWITRLRYLYFSTTHWHPLVNGYSGYVPRGYGPVAAGLRALPGGEAVRYFGSLGVTRIIVHTELLTAADAARWRALDAREVGLREVGRFGSAVAYEIAGR
jgi:hypothetical protein